MSSSSSPMDYQKPVKVKSRWTQSCQMEMMMDESQSSLDMSDTITDVSTSDLNENTDNSSELNSMKLRRSRRISSNRTDYRQLNGLQITRKKKSSTLKMSHKKGRKKKQLLNSTSTDKDDQFKDNILKESNIFKSFSTNWDNITIYPSERKSKSVNNLSKVIEDSPKPIRRASLSWGFTFTSTEKVEDNSLLKIGSYDNISNEIKCLNLNETLLEVTSSSIDNIRLGIDDNLVHKEIISENISQKSNCAVIDAINSKDFQIKTSTVLKMNKFIKASNNSAELNLENELGHQTDNSDTEKTQHTNHLVTPKFSLSEFENFKFSPNYKPRRLRSKSVDNLTKNPNNTIKRCQSYNDLNKLEISIDFALKLQKPHKKLSPKKRRQSKRIKPKNNCTDILDEIKVPEIDYNQVADEIYKEHKNQLYNARINDEEFDKKLKSTNFTLINENVYRPNKQNLKLYPSSEISALRKLKKRVISGDINDYCECTLTKEDIIDGITGCDDRCLNRLLKVECGSGCSLRGYCTNKQFQNKQFKRSNIIKTENKGYGICAVEDIPKGVLINEYVGEVIDYNEMCNRLRKKEYANLNYMVQLNPDEIIDSTFKGNVTRFLNHSCNPNAVGEKWHVLGQSRIGFFSTRHIKKGEEITFDYSFQIFGDGAQICYCGSSNCRGYISKASQITDLSSSEDSDSTENRFVLKSEEKQRKKGIFKKRTIYNKENTLRELGRQLTEIAKLKTGLKTDQELATLNLNRLMVHITDSVSRLHVLKFIREHDMNKRLFMDFSGLSIIHNWMTSNENESFKLMILEILNELPITNRNTITKSKVLDVVAEWAKIPQDIKTKIESLDYPNTELQNHYQEVNNLLPKSNETVNDLVEKARDLWKKWIILKMVFKIPKKIDQLKPIDEINSKQLTENSNPSPMDVSWTLDQKVCRISNKNINKARNQQIVSLERMKLRKEYEFKVEQERQKNFRKKVMDDWYEKLNGVVKKIPNQNCMYQQTLNYPTCDNSSINYNNGISKQTRWDCTLQTTHINSISNYNIQNPCLNFIPQQALQQPLIQFPQYSYTQPQIFANHLINHSTFFNTPPPPLPNQPLLTQPQQCTSLLNSDKPVVQNIEPPERSPTRLLLKSAKTNVFNLINESLQKHYITNKNRSINTETEHSNKLCSRTVQSGADLLARIKVISNSFQSQPSKLIKIKDLKQTNNKIKTEKIPLSDLKLKSFCDKNKRIIFINEQAGITSNTLNKDMMPTPKTIPLSGKNKFSNAIFKSLLKKTGLEKESLVPKKFILKNDNSDLITCHETDKEIELYKNMKPKIIKKVVAHVKTKNGLVGVVKRKWGIKLKGLNGNNNKIPATKRNLMRKGSIHHLKNCLVNTTKSALKKKNNISVDDYLKKPKEKRVTFWIEGETSPIFPHSEVRPINLNQDTVKQKPLMKCHPFEIRNEPKSILLPSTSGIHSDNLLFSTLEQSAETTNDQIIKPIVAKFKASRSRRISLREKSIDLEQLLSQRKHMIPVSMMSLSVDVLKLIPDNRKEMKKVIDYYHSMATVIVKTLGSYAKKTCQQGRIRSDEDFKYLAKKINENVLSKELQLKKVDKLKISNSTKDKVAEYIRKYMSRFGEIYKRKPHEQTNHHKAK